MTIEFLIENSSFLQENYESIKNKTFILTEDSKEKLEADVEKYIDEYSKVIEDYRKSTNKLKFKTKLFLGIEYGMALLGLVMGALPKYFKLSEVILNFLALMLSAVLALISSNKLEQEFFKLRQIKRKLKDAKAKCKREEDAKKIQSMIDKIDKILKPGLKKVEESVNMDVLISNSYENLLEFENIYHEICMDMIKCEHNAIVNEDMVMLMEAEEEFKTRLINALKTAWNNFVNFINKAIATISSLQVKIVSTFFNQKTKKEIEDLLELIKASNEKSETLASQLYANLKKRSIESRQLGVIMKEEELDKAINRIADLLNETNLSDKTEALNKAIDGLKPFRGLKVEVKNFYDFGYKPEAVGSLITHCYKVFQNREKWIKTLKALKDTGMKQYKADLKAIQEGKLTSQDKLNIAKVHRACNSMIFAINYMTIDSIKIMNTVKSVSIGIDWEETNRKSKEQYEKNKNNDMHKYNVEPPLPKIDREDSSKWHKTDNNNFIRIHKGNDYVNLASDEEAWLDYIRYHVKRLNDDNRTREAAKLRMKAIKLGYTNESASILDQFA